MSIRLANALSAVRGMTGHAMLTAILRGVRDPPKPAALRVLRGLRKPIQTLKMQNRGTRRAHGPHQAGDERGCAQHNCGLTFPRNGAARKALPESRILSQRSLGFRAVGLSLGRAWSA